MHQTRVLALSMHNNIGLRTRRIGLLLSLRGNQLGLFLEFQHKLEFLHPLLLLSI